MDTTDKTGAEKAPIIKKEGTNTPVVKSNEVSKKPKDPVASKAPKATKEPKVTVTPKVTTTDKVSNEFSEKAANFFKENPKAKEVFISADGFLFTNRNFACNHATTLENKEPFHFKNPTLLEVVEEIEE